MNRKIPLFSAKCGDCKNQFERPSLGSFSYGENILSTIDGKCFVLVSAFDSFPEKVKNLIPESKSEMFWVALADLADPIQHIKLTSEIICPNCYSTNIEIIKGERTGEVAVNEASFLNASKLSNTELSNLVFTVLKNA